MKKLLMLFAAIALSLSLAACNGEEALPELPETVDMTNVDEYMNRPDVQYVDLRNFDDKMMSGYIAGFEFIPFFDYLELEDILVRTDGNWDFADADLMNEAALRGLFDEDKTIFLMCGSGTRAGYVMAALESLDYTVYNVGGIRDYDGANLVLGDDSYLLDTVIPGDFTPGTYYGFDPVGGYAATVIINARGGISFVEFDAVQGGTTKQVLGFDYGMVSRGGADYEWFEHANMLADYVLANQGWGDIQLTETAYDATWNALTVPHHIIEFDAENNPDDVAGVTIGAEGFVFAWNDAISQASTSDLGVVDVTITPEQWADAHGPAFDYEDGVYFGLDEAHGYSVKVTVEDSVIVDVFFDALYEVFDECLVDGVADATITRASNCTGTDGSTYEVVSHWSTKQVLGEDYGMRTDAGLTWAEMVNDLADAIIDVQQWSPAWDIIEATDGGHDYFDATDQDVIDDVAGVTAGIEGLLAAWEEAIAQAIPSS